MLLLLFAGETADVNPDVSIEVTIETATASARTRPGTYPNPADAPGWVLKVTDREGEVIQTLAHPTGVEVTRTLNTEPELSFASPKYDATTSAIELLRTEIQAYRNDDLKFAGPVLSDQASSSDGKIGFAARGPWWYFRRRHFGTANRISSITNGDFETGPADGTPGVAPPSWTAVELGMGIAHYRGEDAEDLGLPSPLSGTKAVAMFADPNGGHYLRNRWAYRTEHPPGQRVTVAAWVYLVAWGGPAGFDLGLYLGRVVDGTVTRQNYAPINPSTPRGRWVRLETSVVVPPHEDGLMETRLYAPGGLTVWDASRSALMESLGSSTGSDQTALAAGIIRYGQAGRGKSDLNVGTDCPATSIYRVRSWQFADHEWLDTAVEELANFPNGFDHRIDVTPRTRTFRTFFPRAGTDRRETLTLELGVNVASYTRDRDGASVSTSVLTKAPGDSPTREEGLAQDLAALDGLVLEEQINAPEEIEVDELDPYAADYLAGVKEIIPVPELVITDEDLIALLEEPGDLVRVIVDDGYVQIDGDYRIVRTKLTASALTLTINSWSDP